MSGYRESIYIYIYYICIFMGVGDNGSKWIPFQKGWNGCKYEMK